MALESGTLLHKRYRIVEVLGKGGMGSVYRAVDEHLGVDVAVKENLFSTEEYARQFRLEAVIVANLRHPNLPRVSDHFVIAGQGQYLVMDFVEGEDLRQYMERVGLLTEDDVIRIGSAMCDALTYLHTRKPPILHRDIKPGNVKVTSDGRVILVDFGLAKVFQENQSTTIGARAMTPGYSPPEQYGTARTDHRTDIYSLGATLYAALCGVIPEDGLVRAMDNAELTPLRKRNPDISRRLAGAIEKALSVDPDDRFQNGEEFKRALIESKSKPRFMAGIHALTAPPINSPGSATADVHRQPVKLAHSNAGETERPFVSPRKKLLRHESRVRRVVIGLLLAIIATGLLAVNYFFPGRISQGAQALFSSSSSTDVFITVVPVTPTHIPQVTVLPTSTATLPLELPPGSEGQLQIAFASTRLGVSQIYITDLAGNNITQLTKIEEGACQPAWSPDGQKLVFTSPCKLKTDSYPDSSLYIMNADGTGLKNLQSVPGGDFEPSWSPDGMHIAFTSIRTGDMQVYVYDLETNIATRLTQTLSASSRQPAWSPDGRQIAYAFSRGGDSYQIWLMSDTGKNQRRLVQSSDQFSDYAPEWSPDGSLILFHQKSSTEFTFPALMMMSLEPDAKPVKLYMGILSVDHISYARDGFWLAYESAGERGSDIYAMTVSGANKTQLTDDPQDDFDPAWRPMNGNP